MKTCTKDRRARLSFGRPDCSRSCSASPRFRDAVWRHQRRRARVTVILDEALMRMRS